MTQLFLQGQFKGNVSENYRHVFTLERLYRYCDGTLFIIVIKYCMHLHIYRSICILSIVVFVFLRAKE